jgi:threonylcarbamoyladenosine tRNA methylthiotransferase MtaB
VGAYVSGNTRLAGLLARLLAETTIERIRLSSLQPGEIDENLLYLWENPRLCPHFHLALQSGSDRTLSAMGRRYDTAGFIHTLDLIRSTVPGAAITTDVMAGFPGETDLDFTASLQFCQEMDFAAIHAFSYSPRPGTAAANFKGQVPEHTRRQRLQALLRLSRASSRSYRQKFIGNTMPVLWENAPPQGGLITGLTPNYIRVEAAYLPAMENTLNMARLVSINGDNVAAEVIQAPRP